MIVVKLGGSLFVHTNLIPGLRAYLASLPEPVLLVPGGGVFVNIVRRIDAEQGLGEEAAHWMALKAMRATTNCLRGSLRSEVSASRLHVLDALEFCTKDDTLPHSWAVTSDTIAARVAVVHGASRLILLKSIDIPSGTSWATAAANGWVDEHFPIIIADAPFPVEVVNFRQQLEQFSHPA